MPKTVSSQDVADRRALSTPCTWSIRAMRLIDLVTGIGAPAMCSWCCPSVASTSWRLASATPWRHRVSAGDWLDSFPGVLGTSRSLDTVNLVLAAPPDGSSPREMSTSSASCFDAAMIRVSR